MGTEKILIKFVLLLSLVRAVVFKLFNEIIQSVWGDRNVSILRIHFKSATPRIASE
jgi:hypothetical protein